MALSLPSNRTAAFVLAACGFLFLVYEAFRHFFGHPTHIIQTQLREHHLQSLVEPHVGAQASIRYAQIQIRVHHGSNLDNRSLPALAETLSPQFIETSTFSTLDQSTFSPRLLSLKLPAPQYREHDAGKIMVGLATEVQRLRDNLDHMKHWAANTGLELLALTPPDPGAEQLARDWRAMGIKLTLVHESTPFLDRLVALLPAMRSHAEKQRLSAEWYMIVDDDTFLPSVSRLASALAAYDHTHPFYIGGISEPRADLSSIGYFAYGGAGIIFSSALAQQVSPHFPRDCLEQGTVTWGGDGRIAECVQRFSTTRLTYLRDLHQMDIVGDMSGIYESGFKPLTLHHWRGWANIPMPKVALVAAVTGGRGLFQRWRFADNWVLTNGYSLVHYEQAALDGAVKSTEDGGREVEDGIDFSKTEFTWENGGPGDFEHSLGPFRRRLGVAEKASWLFIDAEEDESAVSQFYLRKEGQAKVPEVIELVWIR